MSKLPMFPVERKISVILRNLRSYRSRHTILDIFWCFSEIKSAWREFVTSRTLSLLVFGLLFGELEHTSLTAFVLFSAAR